MRLNNYLTEKFPAVSLDDFDADDAVERIKRDCGQFLKEFKRPIYRGTRDVAYGFWMDTRRKDRRPRNTNIVLHGALDDAFQKVFGWRPRGQGVFVTGNDGQASSYGGVHLFFPVGKYRYVWSPSVSDLFTVATGRPDRAEKTWNIDMNLWDGEKDMLVTDVPLNALTKQNYDDFAKKQIEELVKDNYTNKGYGKARNQTERLHAEAMFDCDKYYMLANHYAIDVLVKLGMKL